MDAETYFLEIERAGSAYKGPYKGHLHRGDPSRAVVLEDLELGADAKVDIDGEDHRLGTLVDKLLAFDLDFIRKVLDERGQLALGSHLYRQTMRRVEPLRALPAEADIRLRIVADETEEEVARLPWVLLARDGVFLCATGWSAGLCHRRDGGGDYELPPSPKMLVAIPDPDGVQATGGEQHLDQLEDHLASADARLVRGQHLAVARTWDEFRALAAELKPSVVYFYGHGEGDRRSSRLVFEAAGGKRRDVPLADVAHHLRRAGGDGPLLAYVNCCGGDAGGVLGAGWQLGSFIPAVLTNRTAAYAAVSRRQALAFWDATLIRGVAPHAAVSGLYHQLGDLGLSFRDVRWMTPVFHGSYDRWQANPPRASSSPIADPHWQVKLDRVPQFSQLTYQTREMMRTRRPVSRAWIWYGREGQGIDVFHDRIRFELRGDLEDTTLHRIQPAWPDELDDPHRSFTDMVTRAFEVSSLDALPGRVRTLKRGETGRRILVFVRHASLRGGDPVKPSTLKTYLDWWHHNVTPRLHDAGGFALIGLSFVVKDPARFRGLIRNKIDDAEGRRSVRILDELKPITREDLEDFLAAYEISLPRRRKDRVLERILADTGGRYEPTVEALRNLQSRAWDFTEDAAPDDENFDDESDF